jgi:uncharacterized FlgJ-related protein
MTSSRNMKQYREKSKFARKLSSVESEELRCNIFNMDRKMLEEL